VELKITSMSVVHGVVFFQICEVNELVIHPQGDLVREKKVEKFQNYAIFWQHARG
jgi:hypothetical protein